MSNTTGLPIQKGYIIKDNTYVKQRVMGGRAVDVEVGDSKESENFVPQIKVMQLGNRFNFGARYILPDGVSGKEGKEKLTFSNDKEKVEFFETKYGYEINIVLNEKPKSNVFEFSLNSKDVLYVYQPDIDKISAEDKVTLPEGSEQPERLKGSYAVYAAYRPDGIKTDIFRYGKLGHIYRPWVEDTVGKFSWCELNITEDIKKLTVTVPWEFLNSASYPVTIDPEFGFNDGGEASGTAAAISATNQVIMREPTYHYTAGSDEQIDSLHFYGRTNGTNDPASIDMGVYDMGIGSNDVTNSTLHSSGTITFSSTSPTWEAALGVNEALTDTKNYALSVGNRVDGAGSNPVGYYDLSSANGVLGMGSISSAGALAATYNYTGSNLSYNFHMYATVGATPGPPQFSGTIPDSAFARTDSISISTASYFTNPETFVLNNAPGFLSINSTTGVITNTGTNVNGVYSGITVTCTNGLGNDTSNTFQITINAQAPTLDTAITNKTGNVGSPITTVQTSLNFSYATSYGATGLPDGLSIDSVSGDITGTPTTEQGYTGIFVTATNADGSTNSNTFSWTIGAALPIPTIVSVNAGNNLQATEQITITGTNFEAVQGSGTVVFNGVTFSVDTWSDTSIVLTVPRNGVARYGINHDLVITNDSGYSVTVTEQYQPQSGYAFTTLSSNYAQLPPNSIFANNAAYSGLVTGDQPDYDLSASPEGTVSMTPLGVVEITGATSAGDYTFAHGILDVSDLNYSSNGTSTVTLSGSGADVTAPAWVSTPSVSSINTTGATLSATTNEPGAIYVVIVPQSEPTPSVAQVRAGQNSSGSAATWAYSATATTSFNQVVSDQDDGTDYKACFVAEDDEATPNLQAGVTVVNYSTVAIADNTPPAFTVGPIVDQVTSSGCRITASIDEPGTIYWLITEQGNPNPSTAQVINGVVSVPPENPEDPNVDSPALRYGNASDLDSVSVSGLVPAVAYKAAFAARDTASNAQINPVIINFTTSPANTTRTTTEQLVNRVDGLPVASTSLDYYIATAFGQPVTDSGQVTTDVSGNYSITNLNIAAGTGWIVFRDSATGQKIAAGEITITEA